MHSTTEITGVAERDKERQGERARWKDEDKMEREGGGTEG